MFDESNFDGFERRLKRFAKILKELRAASDMGGLEAAAFAAEKFERISSRLKGVLSDINSDLVRSAQIQSGITNEERRRLDLMKRRKDAQDGIDRMIQRERKNIEKMNADASNSDALRDINDKIAAEMAGNHATAKQKQESAEKIVDLEKERTRELAKQSRLADDIADKQKELNELEKANAATAKAAALADAARKRADAVVGMRGIAKKGFAGMGMGGIGGLYSAIGSGGNMIGGIFRMLGPALGLTGGAALATGILGGAVAAAAIGYYKMLEREVKGMRVLQMGGLSGDQTGRESIAIQQARRRLMPQGIYASAEEMAQASMGLQSQFGGTAFPEKLLDNAAVLTAHFHMSAEEAGKLQAAMFRLSGYSEKSATTMTKFLTSLSGGATNVRMIGQLLAQNTEEIAKSGMTTDLIRTSVGLAHSGVQMSTMSRLADKMSTDLEGTLDIAAKISNIAPGVDFQRTWTAAVSGDITSFTEELKTALKGMDLQHMNRSQLNYTAGTLGMSVEELKNFVNGGDMRDLQTKTYDEVAGGHTELIKMVTGQNTMVGLLTDIASALVQPRLFQKAMGVDYDPLARAREFSAQEDALAKAHAHGPLTPQSPTSPSGGSEHAGNTFAYNALRATASQFAEANSSETELIAAFNKVLGPHFDSMTRAIKENRDVYLDSHKVTDALRATQNRGG